MGANWCASLSIGCHICSRPINLCSLLFVSLPSLASPAPLASLPGQVSGDDARQTSWPLSFTWPPRLDENDDQHDDDDLQQKNKCNWFLFALPFASLLSTAGTSCRVVREGRLALRWAASARLPT